MTESDWRWYSNIWDRFRREGGGDWMEYRVLQRQKVEMRKRKDRERLISRQEMAEKRVLRGT